MVPLANRVLYFYNKAVFNEFMDKIENLIIMEFFLNCQNQFFFDRNISSKPECEYPKEM